MVKPSTVDILAGHYLVYGIFSPEINRGNLFWNVCYLSYDVFRARAERGEGLDMRLVLQLKICRIRTGIDAR